MLQAESSKNKVSGPRLPERTAIGIRSHSVARATGGTPQTSGAGQLGDYKEGCGYNKIFEHRVLWQTGFYDGRDEDWREIGIPMHVIESINNEVKGMLPLVGKSVSADNTETKEIFEWEPIPFKKTVLDCAKSIENQI